MSDEMEIVAILDKEKLPEDVRKIIEEKFSKDLQNKIYEMLKNPNNNPNNNPNDPNNNTTDNKLFAIQTGTIVGNIYKDNK